MDRHKITLQIVWGDRKQVLLENYNWEASPLQNQPVDSIFELQQIQPGGLEESSRWSQRSEDHREAGRNDRTSTGCQMGGRGFFDSRTT